MKKLKIIFYCFVILLIFIIYTVTNDKKISYIALGDSVANGLNPYGTIDYSYTDYIGDYLRSNGILKKYINEFTENDSDFEKMLLQIVNDMYAKYNNKKISLKKELRESDIVTISIGQQDLNNKLSTYYDFNKISFDTKIFREILLQIKKYAKNKIIVVGYYAPLLEDEIDTLKAINIIKKINSEIKGICSDEGVVFVDIFDDISLKKEFFPNPKSMNINIYGQKQIYNKIMMQLNRNF